MRNLALLAALVLSVLPGCSPKQQRPQGPLSVFVSIPPQKYFVERIGGRHVSVSVMVGAGQSPATYEPTPRQIARLASARIFFRIGVPFERAFVRRIAATFDELTIVDTSRGVPLRRMQQPRDLPNAHEGNDVETGTDPHIWLNPRLVKIQADTIKSRPIPYARHCATPIPTIPPPTSTTAMPSRQTSTHSTAKSPRRLNR